MGTKVVNRFREGERVLVTLNVLHNDTGKEFEGRVYKVEHNQFRGEVIYVDAGEYGQFFDVAENFEKLN